MKAQYFAVFACDLESSAVSTAASRTSKAADRMLESSPWQIATLNADPEFEEAWAAEVERRRTEIENGTVTLLPGPTTLIKLRAEFE